MIDSSEESPSKYVASRESTAPISLINISPKYCDDATENNSITANNNKLSDKSVENQPEMYNKLLNRLAKRFPFLGIAFALMASLLSVMASTTMKSQHTLQGLEFTFYRCQFVFLYMVVTIFVTGRLYKKKNFTWPTTVDKFAPNNGERKLYIIRSFVHSMAIGSTYHGLMLLTLPDFTTLRFTQAMWTLIIARIFLGEFCSGIKILALVFSMLGMVSITRPDDAIKLIELLGSKGDHEQHLGNSSLAYINTTLTSTPTMDEDNSFDLAEFVHSRLFGAMSVVFGSLCGASSWVMTKSCKSTPTSVLMFWFSVFLGGLSCLLVSSLSSMTLPDSWWVIFMILLNVGATMLAQTLSILAVKVEDSGVVTLVRTFDIVVAFVTNIVILHEEIKITSIAGSILIGFSVMLIVLDKLVSRKLKKEQSNCFLYSICFSEQ